MNNHCYDLRPVWKIILDIYQVFSKLCERHGLTYWVAYGSVLGAVRHKGFIPWDDDFDVLMPSVHGVRPHGNQMGAPMTLFDRKDLGRNTHIGLDAPAAFAYGVPRRTQTPADSNLKTPY